MNGQPHPNKRSKLLLCCRKAKANKEHRHSKHNMHLGVGLQRSPLIPQSGDSLTQRLNPEKIFGRSARLHVDLGCGDGSFLCALAQRVPEKNFLGLERLASRILSAERKATGIGNMRLLHIEGFYAVRYLLPAGLVETFYLLFPDPWPKRCHHHRRIVTVGFLASVHAALDDSGLLLIATDHSDYFREVKRVAQNHSGFAIMDVTDGSSTPESWRRRVDLPLTKFQQKFLERGVPIYWLELRKVSPVR
jgi:tRNA (guanine-N7-)-methyltransferase